MLEAVVASIRREQRNVKAARGQTRRRQLVGTLGTFTMQRLPNGFLHHLNKRWNTREQVKNANTSRHSHNGDEGTW